jgi:Flp pilus assembly protein TadD
MLANHDGPIEEIERLLRKVIELRPDHAHAYNALGYTLADRNLRLPEAKALIEQALKLAPDDAYIIDSMGWVEYRLGNLSAARRYLERAWSIKPDAEIGAHLGEVLWKAGEQARARETWRAAREKNPDNDTLRNTLKRFGVEL